MEWVVNDFVTISAKCQELKIPSNQLNIYIFMCTLDQISKNYKKLYLQHESQKFTEYEFKNAADSPTQY